MEKATQKPKSSTVKKVFIAATVIVIVVAVAAVIIGVTVEPRILSAGVNGFIRTTQPRKKFYSKEEMYEIYPEAREFEQHWPEIKAEFLALQKVSSAPAIRDIDGGQKGLNKDGGWKGVILRTFNADVPSNMELCPVTASICKKSSKTVSCFFSIVEAGKQILPHTGYYGAVLRFHLGVIVPKDRLNCFIDVGGELYSWTEGEGVMFDDLYRHYVKNNTDEDRVVLFVDVMRPLHPSALDSLNAKALNWASKSKRIMNAAKKSEIQVGI